MDSLTAVKLPRIAIQFCVQCKWNLRAAYYAQELLQTFPDLGEVSLQPVTGGIFTITLYHRPATPQSPQKPPTLRQNSSKASTDSRPGGADDFLDFISSRVNSPPLQANLETTVIWDRRRDGGFPETKDLKDRVRNVVDPKRVMGHVDRALNKDRERTSQSDMAKVEDQGQSPRQRHPRTSSQRLGEEQVFPVAAPQTHVANESASGVQPELQTVEVAVEAPGATTNIPFRSATRHNPSQHPEKAIYDCEECLQAAMMGSTY